MSKKPIATEAEVLALANLNDRNNLLKTKSVPEPLLEKYFSRFSGNVIAKYQDLSEGFILRRGGQMDWKVICKYQVNKLSPNTIVQAANTLYWKYLIKYQTVPESIIEKFMQPGVLSTQIIDLRLVAKYQHLSDTFIQNHWTKLDHNIITQYQNLSEFLLKKYAADLDWALVCRYQTLSETFMIQNHLKMVWKKVMLYQCISPQFVRVFIDKFVYEAILEKRSTTSENEVVTIPPEIDQDDPEIPLI